MKEFGLLTRLRHFARKYKIVAELVYGRKSIKAMTGLAAIRISHIENLYPNFGMANPATNGPTAGAQ